MYKKTILIAAVLGALAVALGAMGAHALEGLLTEKMQKAFETAARYQMYHALALLACGVLQYTAVNHYFTLASKLFIWGTALFCGSLYLLVIFYLLKINNLNFIGAITPLGGICFMAGWICIALGAAKLNRQ